MIKNISFKYEDRLIEYSEAINQMESYVNDVIESRKGIIWFLEHLSVYTAGTSAKNEELLDPIFKVHKTGRGGKYTYHGPGQLIIYFILDLKEIFAPKEPDLHEYIYSLEQILINTLAEFGIGASRKKDKIGIWVGDNKIAAIGIRVRKWVSFHGVALNINPDMSHFKGIIPCGINEFGVTSFEKLGVDIDKNRIIEVIKKHSKLVFGKE